MTIPASIRQISVDWLDEVLHEVGTLGRSTRVVSVTHRPIDGVSGLLGEIGRLHVAYDSDAAAAPASFVVKGPSLAPENRAAAMATGCYEHEVRFYREVAPRLDVRVPRCLAAEIDTASETSCSCSRTSSTSESVIRSLAPRRTRLGLPSTGWPISTPRGGTPTS